MSLENILAAKKIKNPVKEYKKELKEIVEGNILTKLFSKSKLKKEVAELGLALLKLDHSYSGTYVYLGSEKLNFFSKHLSQNVWDNKNYYELLVYFYGAEQAPYVKLAWSKLPYQMYQTGYDRRSFRAPNNHRELLVSQVNLLRSLIEAPHIYNYAESTYYNLTLLEQVRYDNDVTNNTNQFKIWSAALDAGNSQVYQLMEDIIFNKDAVGKVSRGIIKALLNSDKKECWELVEKLLLAAQRQEGLRQTILESLDETSIGALTHMIDVLVTNKLTRFSSVVRAIDTWTGLGWESEKETTVRNIIQLANGYLTNPETIAIAIQSKNNTEVYMALWAQGVLDIEKTVPYLKDLMENGSIEKKCLALKFAGETNDPYIEMPLYYKALEADNLQVLAFAQHRMEALLDANSKSKFFIDNLDYPNFFNKVYELTQKINEKEKTFEGKVFSWLTVKFQKDVLNSCAIHLMGSNKTHFNLILKDFENLSLPIREKLTREVLGDFYCYSYYYISENKAQKLPTTEQRDFALRILKDRGEAIVASALCTLKKVALSSVELDFFQQLFKRKNSTLKKHLISILLQQKESVIEDFIYSLIENGDLEQRLSALDIILQFQKNNKLTSKIKSWVTLYAERPKLSEKESKFLDQISPSSAKEQLSEANGYGFYDPTCISPYSLPKLEANSIYLQLTKNESYGFSQPLSKIKKEIERLTQLYKSNVNYEYVTENWNGSKETVLLGNDFSPFNRKTDAMTAEQRFKNYPLHDVWQEWMETSGLTGSDLFLLTFTTECDKKEFRAVLKPFVFYYKDFIVNPNKDGYYWNNPIVNILECLRFKFPFEEENAFIIDACSYLYSNLPKSILNYKFVPKKGDYYYNREGNGWQSEGDFDVYLKAINDYDALTTAEKAKMWQLYRWRQFSGLKENEKYSMPPLHLYCEAYEQNLITQSEIYEAIVNTENLRLITDKKNRRVHYTNCNTEDLLKKYEFLQPMIDHVRDVCLDIELKRGDSSTAVTQFVTSFQRIYGINRFVDLLQGLGKNNLHKGYIYYWSNEDLSKYRLFSSLIKSCFPKDTETYADFEAAIKDKNFTEERLIQAAIYAPQWQKFISQYLDWKGLDEGIWWLHAHTKTPSYSEVNSELESEIAKYSAVDIQDFKDGAVDKDWFMSAYKKLGKVKWELLYDAAKYVSEGNGHRRARLYADALTGDLKIREVTAKVKEKRDQDYLRVYGLVPLSKTNPEKDVLNRYEYLQQFKKESKEFGSMKQTSEALAVVVALENLARNAGYPDPVRLTWAMETKQVQSILSKDTQFTIEDTTIGLNIDKEGKADVVALKDGKELKAIPAKFKKNPDVLELNKHRKVLREQWTRSKKGLEEAMIRGDVFSYSEIINLLEHPVIAKHLEKLVFISNEDKIGFFIDGKLTSAKGEVFEANDDTTFRIAHCYDLHKNNVWTDFQSYCFDNKLKQPFKQIFRELYVPTPDELKEKSISRRYAGHQVHPKQTLALLKTRGWKVDYEEGLQKVFHKEGYQVKLYAMADWFSPADVESPTLETIEFHSLKDYKNIPFEAVNPRLFSEVMRDIDLVVSVAHVGGVDPEASHSSIEMRSVLLRETLRLFKVKNVEIIENHALIEGTIAKYSVHLGSAIVHQIPGKYLSILPVQSQHRGRLFLPFADDDPKSAEVMSKVLMLAKDNEIQDPTVLSQIDRK